MDSPPRYFVLGPLAVGADGVRTPTARKQRLLLTRLLLSPNEAVSIDRLTDALWPSRPPASARKLVQLYIHELRELLGETAIETVADGYRLPVSDGGLDSISFERLLAEGQHLLEQGNNELARTTCRRALDLWRGPAFGDAAYEDFARLEGERLEQLRIDCLEAHVTADSTVGMADPAEVQSLVHEHPHREGFRAALMVALYRAGRQSDALDAYEDARLFLDHELGLEPGPRLRQLQQQILLHDPSLANPVSPRASQPSLPMPPTPLLGRERELADLTGLVERRELRLITIAGAGGIGKSRLALELARRLSARFANGAFVVELADVRETRHVGSVILAAVGGQQAPGVSPAEALAMRLGEREVLLILDNVEHLANIEEELAALARQCPRTTIVVTSRRVLHLTGEQVYPVPPLDPASALSLFRSRAEAAAPGAIERIGSDVDVLIGEICRRLDNLPLAIELAAARSGSLTPEALLGRLDNRLGLLIDGPRDLPGRQRTLRETLRWSIDLLNDAERKGLARLAVFLGGSSLDAAETVAEVGPGELQTLVAHSLVNRTISTGQARFSLLETVRDYAVELLGAHRVDAELRHARYFADLASAHYQFLVGPDYLDGSGQAAWLRRLDGEAANMRSAFAWTIAHNQSELALRLAAGLWRYRHVRGQLSEGLDETERALALNGAADPKLVGPVLAGGAGLAWALGRQQLATTLAQDAIVRAADDSPTVLAAENVLGLAASAQGRYGEARHHFERLRLLSLEAGSDATAMTAVINLGEVAFAEGDFDAATAHWLDFLDYWRERGSQEGIGLGSLNLGFAALRLNRPAEAAERFSDAFTSFETIGFREHIGYSLVGLAAVEARTGDPARGGSLFGAAMGILEEVGSASSGLEPGLAAQTEAELRAALGDLLFTEASELGRRAGTSVIPSTP